MKCKSHQKSWKVHYKFLSSISHTYGTIGRGTRWVWGLCHVSDRQQITPLSSGLEFEILSHHFFSYISSTQKVSENSLRLMTLACLCVFSRERFWPAKSRKTLRYDRPLVVEALFTVTELNLSHNQYSAVWRDSRDWPVIDLAHSGSCSASLFFFIFL